MDSKGAKDDKSSAGKELTLDEVIAVLEMLAESMDSGFDDYVSTYKSQFGIPSTQQAFENFQLGIANMTDK